MIRYSDDWQKIPVKTPIFLWRWTRGDRGGSYLAPSLSLTLLTVISQLLLWTIPRVKPTCFTSTSLEDPFIRKSHMKWMGFIETLWNTWLAWRLTMALDKGAAMAARRNLDDLTKIRQERLEIGVKHFGGYCQINFPGWGISIQSGS